MSDSHIRIKNEYFRNPEYIKFLKLIKSTVFYFLQAHIVRESRQVKNYTFGAQYIYNEHFLKRRLVARYSQKDMAKYLGTSQSRIAICLAELEKDGLIKIIRKKVSSGIICYYQFGTWGGKYGDPSYGEIIWHDEYFSNNIIQAEEREEEDLTDIGFDEIYGDQIGSYFANA